MMVMMLMVMMVMMMMMMNICHVAMLGLNMHLHMTVYEVYQLFLSQLDDTRMAWRVWIIVTIVALFIPCYHDYIIIVTIIIVTHNIVYYITHNHIIISLFIPIYMVILYSLSFTMLLCLVNITITVYYKYCLLSSLLYYCCFHYCSQIVLVVEVPRPNDLHLRALRSVQAVPGWLYGCWLKLLTRYARFIYVYITYYMLLDGIWCIYVYIYIYIRVFVWNSVYIYIYIYIYHIHLYMCVCDTYTVYMFDIMCMWCFHHSWNDCPNEPILSGWDWNHRNHQPAKIVLKLNGDPKVSWSGRKS